MKKNYILFKGYIFLENEMKIKFQFVVIFVARDQNVISRYLSTAFREGKNYEFIYCHYFYELIFQYFDRCFLQDSEEVYF